ncbi:MAG: hypothetical protein FJZ00_06105 [Candidatus Sericytochromatia bacterium]|uniref:Uncharacterized protein n=1 Tax=Candidatus Tanganyikabacteria bacterium TaxID=2961651 RepID=A0A937X2F5_9BACT|nr:hypothetical protein [Candidatus Tanganyikabacteria bacterium]
MGDVRPQLRDVELGQRMARVAGWHQPGADRPVRDGDDGHVSLGQHVLRFVPDLFIGGGEAAWEMAKGIGTLVFHPIRTAKGMWTLATKLVTEPGTTLKALGAALVDPYVSAVKSGHPGRALGRGIVEIGSLLVSPADVVNVARGGRAFAGATYAGLKSGEKLGRTLSAATQAASYSMTATKSARNAQILAKLGKADQALAMAHYASDSLLVSQLGRRGAFSAMDAALKGLDLARPIRVGGVSVKLGTFLNHTSKTLGLRRFSVVSGHLHRDIYSIASQATKAENAFSLAERILSAGSSNPNLFQRLGSAMIRNPQAFGPLTPALGKVPDLLGRMDSLPTDLPTKEGLTPQAAKEIAFKYNLEDSVKNVSAFIGEVSGYAGNTIGPDTGSPEQIKQLQVLLKANTYDIAVTGVWDRTTANSVIDFKKSNSIRQSYRLANGEHAVNEYADSNVINMLLANIDGGVKDASKGQHPLMKESVEQVPVAAHGAAPVKGAPSIGP